MTSLALHGAAVAVMLLVAYASSFDNKKETPVFELVAGEGDNFGATEAAALGTPGIKVNVPAIPLPTITTKPEPEPVKTVEPEPTPPPPKPEPKPKPPEPVPTVAPTPTPPKPEAKDAPKAPTKERTLTQEFKRKLIVEESRAKMKKMREEAAEKKRLDAEKKEREKAAKLVASNMPRVDTEGIKNGVKGGSTANKTGGAGGTALTRPDGPVMDAYYAYLKQELLKSLKRTLPPGLGDTLSVEVEFFLSANGSLTNAKVVTSSGNAEFDRAAVDACRLVKMTARPDKDSSVVALTFRTKDLAPAP